MTKIEVLLLLSGRARFRSAISSSSCPIMRASAGLGFVSNVATRSACACSIDRGFLTRRSIDELVASIRDC